MSNIVRGAKPDKSMRPVLDRTYPVSVTCNVDVYLLGLLALEMANLGIPDGHETWENVPRLSVLRCVKSIKDDQQRDFIRKCLVSNPADRPTAEMLLKHKAMQN